MPQQHREAAQAELSGKAARLKQIPKFNFSIPEACHAAGVGRSTLYEAIAAGELETLKIGKRRLVPDDALRTWLASKRAAA